MIGEKKWALLNKCIILQDSGLRSQVLGVRSQEVGTFAFLLCNVRTELGVRRGVPEFLERLK